MLTLPRLGAVNLALISLYFAPVWGTDAMRILRSPFNGFQDPAQAAVAIYVRRAFALDVDGLVRVSNVLGGIKLVIAASCVAYLIEFCRSLAVKREVDRATMDVVLLLAVGAILIWTVPALALGDPALIRIHATHLLMVFGAVVVVMVERQIEDAAAPALAPSRLATAAAERGPRRFAVEPALPSGLRRDIPAPTYQSHP
jgi:hypothetical protein